VRDLLTALALLLILEGAVCALLPEQMKRIAEAVLSLPVETLRRGGLAATLLGVAGIWLLRG